MPHTGHQCGCTPATPRKFPAALVRPYRAPERHAPGDGLPAGAFVILVEEDEIHRALRAAGRETRPMWDGGLTRLWNKHRAEIDPRAVALAMASGLPTLPFMRSWGDDWERARADDFDPAWLAAALYGHRLFRAPLAAAGGANVSQASFTAAVRTWIDAHGAERVTGWSNAEKQTMRGWLRWGLTDQPSVTADTLTGVMKDAVGLDAQQAKAIQRQMDGMIAEGLTPAQARSRVKGRIATMEAERRERIAVTETAEAFNEANETMASESFGSLPETVLRQPVKMCITALDERVSMCCWPLHEIVTLNASLFQPAAGCPPRSRPTFHVRCRCVVSYTVIVFNSTVQRARILPLLRDGIARSDLEDLLAA